MKKILCLISILCLVFTLMTPVFAYSDVSADADAIKVLTSIGILDGFEDGTFRPEENVTRAQMAKIVCHTLGHGNLGRTTTEFTDVPKDHWAAGYIDVAYNIGIIKGYGDGTFGPEDKITYEQAVKMMVCTLGYETVANRQGGWPTGYLIQGAALDITENIEPQAICTRENIAQLVYNCLEVDLMEETYFTQTIVQNEVTNKTILYDYLNIAKYYDAEITATPTQGISKTADGTFKINGYYNDGAIAKSVKLEVGETNPDNYFGDTVTIYAKNKNNNKNPIALCILADEQQESMEIAVSDFYGSTAVIFPGNANTEGTNTSKYVKLYYKTTDDTKAQYVTLLDSDSYGAFCELVINGVVYTDPDWREIDELSNGVVRFVDAKTFDVSEGKNYPGSDGIYEKVIVDRYYDYVVEEVDIEKSIIITKNDIEITLDESVIYSIVDCDGNEIKLEDVKENDVLSVYCDEKNVEDSEVISIVICNDTVEGEVTEITSKYFYINGDKYQVAGDLIDIEDIKLEDAGIFYLNCDGKVVYADTTAASKDYAVFYDVYTDGARKMIFNVITADSENLELTANSYVNIVTYEMQEGKYVKLPKVRYDFTFEDELIELEKILNTTANGTYTPYIASYTLKSGSTNQIDTIYLAGDIDPTAEKFDSRFGIWEDDISAYYNKYENTFGSYTVDTSTVIFDIPVTVNSSADADKIKVINKNNLTNNKTYYNVSIFEVDKNNIAKAVIINSTSDAADVENSIAIVQSIARAKDNNGDDVYKVYMIQEGKVVTKTTESNEVFDDFGTGTTADGYTQYSLDVAYSFYPGAVIIYNSDASGAIDNLIKIYPTTSTVGEKDDEIPYYQTEFFTTWNNSAQKGWYNEGCDCFIIYGQIADKNTSSKVITINTSHNINGSVENATYTANYGTANVTVVDYAFEDDTEKVRMGSVSDIKKGSYVLVRKADGATKDIVVYNNFIID